MSGDGAAPTPEAAGCQAAPPPQPSAVSIRGRRFVVDRAREGRFWDAFAAGRWEPRTLDLIAALTGPGVLFLDIGAWVGPTTLLAAAGGARVIALEPDPVARLWLGRNLALNPDLAARVAVLGRALSPRPGRVRLTANRGQGGNSMSSTLIDRGGAAWDVETITPSALAALAAPDERVVAKIDIEGGEYESLPAAAPLAARLDAALVSWHPDLALGARRGAARTLRRLWTARRTAAALAAFRDFRLHAVEARGLRRRASFEALAALGVAPALRGDWLLTREAPPP